MRYIGGGIVAGAAPKSLCRGACGFPRGPDLHDRQTGTNTLLSLGTGGVQGDRDSFVYSHCADFNCCVFRTSSTNLDPGDTNGVADVWVRD